MCKCIKCGHKWMPRKFKPQKPHHCPRCQCINWEFGINKKTGRKSNTLEQFYERINKTETCWLWTGTVANNGRGVFKINNKLKQAHRISYEVHFGEIPQGLLVCHKCDNGLCVNPEHLFLGTQQDNINDCVNKNRNAKGSKNWNTKLNEEKVKMIRTADFSERGSKAKISRELGISQTALNYVISGKNWGHI